MTDHRTTGTGAGAGLPPVGVMRWSATRKAAVVEAIEVGRVSADWAIDAYDLSAEELNGWRMAHRSDGLPGLRATRRVAT